MGIPVDIHTPTEDHNMYSLAFRECGYRIKSLIGDFISPICGIFIIRCLPQGKHGLKWNDDMSRDHFTFWFTKYQIC